MPERARAALRDAARGPVEAREAALKSAARILFDETELDCGDVRELVGLVHDGSCK